MRPEPGSEGLQQRPDAVRARIVMAYVEDEARFENSSGNDMLDTRAAVDGLMAEALEPDISDTVRGRDGRP